MGTTGPGFEMTRWEVFRFVGDCLASGVLRRPIVLPVASIPWPLVVEAAGDHFVAPALGWCLRGDRRIPADVRQCFEALLDLNRDRNAILQRALEAAAGSLNEAGVTPMLLKGAAALADDLYPDAGFRVVGDLDLLVREKDIDPARAALDRAGFSLEMPRESLDREPHHLPTRVHADLRVGVDLHVQPVPAALGDLLNAPRMLDRGRPRTWRGRTLLLPDPADWMVHDVVHSQIVDGHYWRGIPRLRPLLELAVLADRYPDARDEAQSEGRLASRQYRRIFVETAGLSDVLLRGTDPALLSPRAAGVLKRTRVAVDRPAAMRWQLYRQFVARNVRRLIQHPPVVARPFRRAFWARNGADIRRRTQIGRW